jgi:hypothetical protein
VCLTQLIRLLVVKLTHSGSNPRFDVCIIFTTNYCFSGRGHPVDSETLLVTDFVNIKIKSAQFFRCNHKGKVYVCVHRDKYSYIYKYLYLYYVS